MQNLKQGPSYEADPIEKYRAIGPFIDKFTIGMHMLTQQYTISKSDPESDKTCTLDDVRNKKYEFIAEKIQAEAEIAKAKSTTEAPVTQVASAKQKTLLAEYTVGKNKNKLFVEGEKLAGLGCTFSCKGISSFKDNPLVFSEEFIDKLLSPLEKVGYDQKHWDRLINIIIPYASANQVEESSTDGNHWATAIFGLVGMIPAVWLGLADGIDFMKSFSIILLFKELVGYLQGQLLLAPGLIMNQQALKKVNQDIANLDAVISDLKKIDSGRDVNDDQRGSENENSNNNEDNNESVEINQSRQSLTSTLRRSSRTTGGGAIGLMYLEYV